MIKTFGKTTSTGSTGSGTSIHGSPYLCEDCAQPLSMSVYVTVNGTTKIKCAIYRTDGVLMSKTEETTPPNGTAWVTLNILNPRILMPNTYILALWQDANSGAYVTITADQGRTKAVAYGEWPTSVTDWTTTDLQLRIYCTYTTIASPEGRQTVNDPSRLERCIRSVMDSRGCGQLKARDVCATEFKLPIPGETAEQKAKRIKRYMQYV